MAFEIIYALSTLYIVRDCTECNYGALTWSSWLLAVTLLFSPLWFNPFSFEMAKGECNSPY
jgi:1,3-beta-glucan synthase